MNLLTLKKVLSVVCLAFIAFNVAADENHTCPALLDYSHQPLRKEQTVNLCDLYQNKVILVVNTASKCGYTPQLKGLEALYQKYKTQGLVVLGFPSNDFYQELAQDDEIASFCEINYGVTFPMFSKSSVKGSNANNFFRALAKNTGKKPQWNFNKYLIDRTGSIVTHYNSATSPSDKDLIKAIEDYL